MRPEVIVLGLETATELVGVAVGDDGGARAGAWAIGRRRHAETLAPAIGHVLGLAGVRLPEVDVVAVDTGPGLFTGLRVGVATAKALAQGMGLGVVAVSSLAVLAHAAFDAGWQGTVASVVDARRDEVFAGTYRRHVEDGRKGLVVVTPPRACSPSDLVVELGRRADGPVLAVGDGAVRYGDVLTGVAGLVCAGASLAGPPPASLVDLAIDRLRAGEEPLSPEAVEPEYLRDADARANWASRQPAPRGA